MNGHPPGLGHPLQGHDEPPAAGPPGGWLGQLGPFALLGAAAAYLNSRWASIPEHFPTHWGADGRANGWGTRTPESVYAPVAIGAALIAVMALLGLLQRHAMRPIHPGAPVRYTELRYRRGILRVLLAGEYMLALTFSWAAMLPLLTAGGAGGAGSPPPSFLLIVIMPVVYVVWTLLYLARLRPRRPPPFAGAGPAAAGHGAGSAGAAAGGGGFGLLDERHWRAGVFYVNPEDPSLMVPKRYGIGYTLNFARPAAWLLMVLLLAVPLGVAAWVLLHALR